MILDMVNQNEALKKFQDNKTIEYEKTQKQVNELMEPKINTKLKQRSL
jgi:hypothetical protein